MQAEMLRAERKQLPKAIRELGARKAVLGFARLPHDHIAQLEFPARIVAAGYGARNAPVAVQKLNVGDIVKVDDRIQLPRQFKLLRRGVVARKHDIAPRNADGTGKHEFGQRGTIHPAPLFMQQPHDDRIGQGLDGKVFPKARVPRKSTPQAAHVLTNAACVVDVKRSGIFPTNALDPCLVKRKPLHAMFSFTACPLSCAAPSRALRRAPQWSAAYRTAFCRAQRPAPP